MSLCIYDTLFLEYITSYMHSIMSYFVVLRYDIVSKKLSGFGAELKRFVLANKSAVYYSLV